MPAPAKTAPFWAAAFCPRSREAREKCIVSFVIRLIDRFSALLGRAVCWLTLGMVVMQFALVLLRYVFGVGNIALQESITWMHALVFLGASAWTLAQDGHVRVDIFYRDAKPLTKAWVDLIGVVLFLWPFCFVLARAAVPYVGNSWAVLEGSTETSGLPGVFLLKSMILFLAFALAVQGLSWVLRCLMVIGGARPPKTPAALPPAVPPAAQ
jgi:TRAP-type mannitol/chloroaromatic compound transport system permease small subunit